MDKNVRFYICPICGNQIGMIKNNGPRVMCCGQEMELMETNNDVLLQGKHLPQYRIDGDEIFVKVGENEHPMEKDHYIMWVALVSDHITSRITLFPEQGTEVIFKYQPNSTIYIYCNKHGLWKTDVQK